MSVLLGAVSACSSDRVGLSALDDEGLAQLASAHQAFPYKVVFSPIALDFDPERINKNEELDAFSTPIEEELFRREFVDMYQEAGFFAEVSALGRGDEREDRAYWLAEAWDRKADLLAEITVHRYQNSWQGRSGLFWPNIFIWGYTWIGSWFIPDEAYESDVEVSIRYVSVHSQREVFFQRFRATATDALDDFERGWHLFGIFRVPGSLGPENWRDINRVVMPQAMQNLKKDLLRDAFGRFRPFAQGEKEIEGVGFQQVMAKKLALVIGISKYRDSGIRSTIKFARGDAEAFHQHLVSRLGADFPERNVVLLVNERATKENVLAEVRGFLQERALAYDEVLIYFSGIGATAMDPSINDLDNFLLPYDASLDNIPASALSLRDLNQELVRLAAKTKVLVLDTSFWGSRTERAVFNAPRTSGWFWQEGDPPAGGPPPARRWGDKDTPKPPAPPAAATARPEEGKPAAAETDTKTETSPASRRWGSGGPQTPAGALAPNAPRPASLTTAPPSLAPARPRAPGDPRPASDPWWGPPLSDADIAQEEEVVTRALRLSTRSAIPLPTEVVAPEWAVNRVPNLVSPQVAVLMSCAPGEGATEIEDTQSGTFTYYLLQGLEGQADLDKDKRITLEELHRFTLGEVYEHSIRLDSLQHPQLYNLGKLKFSFANPEFIVRPEPR